MGKYSNTVISNGIRDHQQILWLHIPQLFGDLDLLKASLPGSACRPPFNVVFRVLAGLRPERGADVPSISCPGICGGMQGFCAGDARDQKEKRKERPHQESPKSNETATSSLDCKPDQACTATYSVRLSLSGRRNLEANQGGQHQCDATARDVPPLRAIDR